MRSQKNLGTLSKGEMNGVPNLTKTGGGICDMTIRSSWKAGYLRFLGLWCFIAIPALFLLVCYVAEAIKLLDTYNTCIQQCTDGLKPFTRRTSFSNDPVMRIAINMYQKDCEKQCNIQHKSKQDTARFTLFASLGLFCWYFVCFAIASIARGSVL